MTRRIPFGGRVDGKGSLTELEWKAEDSKTESFSTDFLSTTSGWGGFLLTPQERGARICESARSVPRISGRQRGSLPQSELGAAEGVQNDHDAGLHCSVCQSTM